MKAYKGFDKNLQCRGFQYAVGKEYETDKAEICRSGFHACEAPLNVWDFYPPINNNRFCEVEQDGDVKNDGAGVKSVSTKIKIGAEIGIPELIKAHVELCKKQTAMDATKMQVTTSGDDAKIGSSGDGAKIGSSGNGAKIECFGRNAVVACAGANNIVKAPKGAWICLSEFDMVDSGYVCVGMKAFRIDGKKFLPDTWYKLVKGSVVKVG